MAPSGDDARDTAGVIARPPLLYGGFLIAGLVLEWLWPTGAFDGLDRGTRLALGAALFIAGGLVGGAAFLRFRDAGTNVPTWLPTTALVTSGVYRYSRNPIYVGLTLAYAGIAVAAASLWTLVFLVPLLGVMRFGVIAREEAYLGRLFGGDYRAYRSRVRRWL